MEPATGLRRKLKSPGQEVNSKTSIVCSNVPDSLFDAVAAKKHFSKFGKVHKIKLFPKRHMCMIEYDQPSSMDRALLNAGAFDGFMFDVTRVKNRVRKHSRKDDDPDWVPDSNVEEELSAMGTTPIYRKSRQKPMDLEPEIQKPAAPTRLAKSSPIRRKPVVKPSVIAPSTNIMEPPVMVTSQTTMTTAEAALELHQLKSKVSVTPDDQWRILDARDRVLRAWGGAGSRVVPGGATVGTCPDMCPEKELLHRQSEYQVMTLESVPDSDGELDPSLAVKQYSRSSADQEIPMGYELRPAPVLTRTCLYLLHHVADTTRQVTLADWFHFMWDRFRSIRKDITQQALCCAESISLVEMCARFHAHCAARLADLEHTQFDQKLNTENLTKCLQTLKHMYHDARLQDKPNEHEFRGYVALLNLGDANFWWEIKQLPLHIQKSEPIIFAIQVFNAIDNNNYIKFFRLIKEKATYLQACILLRYFNDVRARALARIVKAYAPRGGSRYPAEQLISALQFESIEKMKSFITHYGLRSAKFDESEHAVILDRNQFIEDSDPYPVARAVNLIESKRQGKTVGEVIAGGKMPPYVPKPLYSSFTKDGRLKDTALTAADLGYNTINDSNKDVLALQAEIQKLDRVGGRSVIDGPAPNQTLFGKPDSKNVVAPPKQNMFMAPKTEPSGSNLFSFKPAIHVAAVDILKNSPEKILESEPKKLFSFSKPQENIGPTALSKLNSDNIFKKEIGFEPKLQTDAKSIFSKPSLENTVFKGSKLDGSNLFKKPDVSGKYLFTNTELSKADDSKINLFTNSVNKNQPESTNGNIFTNSAFSKPKEDNLFVKADTNLQSGKNIFSKPLEDTTKTQPSIFATFKKPTDSTFSSQNLFVKPNDGENKQKAIFPVNGNTAFHNLSPGSLFKSANVPSDIEPKGYSFFQSKNKPSSVADSIFKSANEAKTIDVYDFDKNEDETKLIAETQRAIEERIKEEERKQQEIIREEERRRELLRIEEERLKEEARKKQELMRQLAEKRRQEEEEKRRREEEKRIKEEAKRQEELRKKLEEQRLAELKRKAEEAERKFKERVDKESAELVLELLNEVEDESVKEILREEMEKVKRLMSIAKDVTEEIFTEVCNDICCLEIKAEKFWTEKLMKKFYITWRKHYLRNVKRRNVLEDTPVWLPDNTPVQEAMLLRRPIERNALCNMSAVNKGYRFKGELRQLPTPEAYNLMEIVRSSLLKRMKQINYPYDKCFFWKTTVVSPGAMKWLHRKVNIEKWLLDVFCDNEEHAVSDTLIHVGKQTWNQLMDFAISVSLISHNSNSSEALEGTNGLLFYTDENNSNLVYTIKDTLKQKYLYQRIPVAVLLPKMEDMIFKDIEYLLTNYTHDKIIYGFRIFPIEGPNVMESLNKSTKSALKWLAKNYPEAPPIEIDYLKSICQRYLGNEIWCIMKSDADTNPIAKDLIQLVTYYNVAVDKLTKVITDEDLLNYPSFPLEFKCYLNETSPYPKPYEFVTSRERTTENIKTIKFLMQQLKLPVPDSEFRALSVIHIQEIIRKYCNQIGWFSDPDEVACKVVAVLPNELTDINMPCEQFRQYFEQYNLLDLLNVIIYERIHRLSMDRLAIYKKSVLEDYRNYALWLYKVDVLSKMKHKAIEYDDELDSFIDAKRRKIAIDSMEYLQLEANDTTIVEEHIKTTNENICKFKNCSETVKQLEKQLDEEMKKSVDLENLLRAALSDV